MDSFEIPVLHRRAGDHFATVVQGLTATAWDQPTPCTDWSVRDLMGHNVVENLWVPSIMAGATIEEVGDRFDGDVLGDDPARAWLETRSAANDAVEEPGATERTVHLSFGDLPGSEYLEQRIVDLVIHAWDLARATGQPERLDPGLVDPCLTWGETWKPMLADAAGIFDPPIDSPPDADPQTLLLHLFGRRPE